MEKYPFSVYDFLGYLFPGMTLLFFTTFSNIECLEFLSVVCPIESTENSVPLIQYILFLVSSYLLGHFVSYLSSETIENMCTRVFGYPSKYLLEKEKIENNKCIWSCVTEEKKVSKCVLILVYVFLFPIVVFLKIAQILRVVNHITRPLSKNIIDAIQEKQVKLKKVILQETNEEPSCEDDFHRVIMHYVYLNVSGSSAKTSNYLTIYGFLRSMCFVACLIFWKLTIMGVVSIFDCCITDTRESLYLFTFDMCLFMGIVVSCASIIMSFLGFVKFYRRFTIEDYMSLLVCKLDEQESSAAKK